ncbi:MAG TPA: CPBP family intramembrane glutamic endopeptidase [Candidatus Angelobacter sp.]|nr:CPBP family intramembrane glutamic endopeptidase [Candidatus Angelobacter sp.]
MQLGNPVQPDQKKIQDQHASAHGGKLLAGAAVYIALLAIFWLVARFFHLKALHDYPVSTFLGFAILFAPYWLFGFGLAPVLQRILQGLSARIAASVLLALPYFVLSLPRGTLHWQVGLALIAIPALATGALAAFPRPANSADLFVLVTLGLAIDLGLLNHGWPFGLPDAMLWPAGLGGFPKMMMANVALYGYLVIKPVEGIGYDLTPQLADWRAGLREFLFYAPIVLSLGVLLGFIHWQGLMKRPQEFPAAWIFTFIFVALPEELFFRGLVQNLLERHMGRLRALMLASILFGLSHFNKGAVFNWRYVFLAAIAGIFYGRAWLAQRRLFASSVTHATVDTIWSIWWR